MAAAPNGQSIVFLTGSVTGRGIIAFWDASLNSGAGGYWYVYVDNSTWFRTNVLPT